MQRAVIAAMSAVCFVTLSVASAGQPGPIVQGEVQLAIESWTARGVNECDAPPKVRVVPSRPGILASGGWCEVELGRDAMHIVTRHDVRHLRVLYLRAREAWRCLVVLHEMGHALGIDGWRPDTVIFGNWLRDPNDEGLTDVDDQGHTPDGIMAADASMSRRPPPRCREYARSVWPRRQRGHRYRPQLPDVPVVEPDGGGVTPTAASSASRR